MTHSIRDDTETLVKPGIDAGDQQCRFRSGFKREVLNPVTVRVGIEHPVDANDRRQVRPNAVNSENGRDVEIDIVAVAELPILPRVLKADAVCPGRSS